MIKGIGTDLLEQKRITSLPEDDLFFARVFTEAERRQAQGSSAPLRYFASHFAGKEAVFKALNADPDLIRLNEIEILNDQWGQPQVTLLGTAAAYAAAAGIGRVCLSLSWEREFCLGFAVSEAAPPQDRLP